MSEPSEVIEVRIRLPLGEKSLLKRFPGESDGEYLERIVRTLDVADLRDGLYGNYRAQVNLIDETGSVLASRGRK